MGQMNFTVAEKNRKVDALCSTKLRWVMREFDNQMELLKLRSSISDCIPEGRTLYETTAKRLCDSQREILLGIFDIEKDIHDVQNSIPIYSTGDLGSTGDVVEQMGTKVAPLTVSGTSTDQSLQRTLDREKARLDDTATRVTGEVLTDTISEDLLSEDKPGPRKRRKRRTPEQIRADGVKAAAEKEKAEAEKRTISDTSFTSGEYITLDYVRSKITAFAKLFNREKAKNVLKRFHDAEFIKDLATDEYQPFVDALEKEEELADIKEAKDESAERANTNKSEGI